MTTTRLYVALTNKVWLSAMPKGLSKPVLLAYCRHANDKTGLSWPSIPRVALMCGLGERTVQQHVRALVQAGILRPRVRTGHSTRYTIHLDSLEPLVFPAAPGDTELLDPEWTGASAVDNSGLTPAESGADPRKSCTPPPQKTAPTPADFAPITVLNFEENSEGTGAPALPATHGAPASPVLSASLSIDDVKPETLARFAAVRRSRLHSKGALTNEVIEGLRAQAHIAGMTLEQVLQTCIERKWGNFEARWLKTKTASAGAAPVTVPGAAPWVPPVCKPASPEVLAAARAKGAQIKATPLPSPALPAMPAGASDITIAADAPPHVIKAAEVVSKYRAGQHVNRFTLESACQTLKISPFGLRTRAPVSVPACASAPVSVSATVH